MSFRIEKHTALIADGFRTALRQQLARAIKELEGSSSRTAARLHSARRRMKKVRSAMRLLKAASFPAVTHTDHDLLRDASAEVAPARDAAANLKALKKLCNDAGCDGLRFSKAFGSLDEQKAAALQSAPDSMHRAATLLKASLSRVGSWDDAGVAWRKIGRGLKHFYKRARTAFRAAANDSSAENFHEWRKRTRDLYHGLKLVQPANPKTVRRLARDAKELEALLGAVRDLSLLAGTLGQSRIGKEKPVLDKLIAARRRELRRKALKLGAKYFSPKPAAFLDKIDG